MTKRAMTMSMIVLAAILILPGIGFSQHTDKSNPPAGDSKKDSDKANKQDRNPTGQGQDSKTTATSGSGSKSLTSVDHRFVMEAAHGGMMEVELGRLALERATSDEVKQFAQRMIDDHSRAYTELAELASTKGVNLPMDASAHGTGSSATGSGQQATSGTTGSGVNPHSGERTDSSGTATTQKTSTANISSGSMARGQQDGDEAKMMQRHQAVTNKLSALSGAEFDREYMRQMVSHHSDAVSMFQRQSTRGNDAELKGWAAKTLPTVQEHERMARDISAKTGK